MLSEADEFAAEAKKPSWYVEDQCMAKRYFGL